ncbi:MAG: mechanosensitive ion channel domain-containing protein [Bacteroidota bacterium]
MSFSEQVAQAFQDYFNLLVSLLPKVGLALVVFIILWFISRWLTKVAGRQFQERVEDQLLARFLRRLTRILLFVFSFAIVLNILGLGGIAAGLLTGAGIGAFVIGFAFKDIGENLLAGIMLAFHRPFNIGHTIEVIGVTGSVIALNLRDTQIKTFDGKDVYIPNAQIIKNKLTNFVIDGFLRQDYNIELDQAGAIEPARQIIIDVLSGIPGILQEAKAPSVHLTDLGKNTKTLTAYYWLDTFDSQYSGLEIKTQALAQSFDALQAAGYYLPGEIVELKTYRDQSLMTSEKKESA